MPVKKELCRNFQSGSCRYGERCKFLHATRQQPKLAGNNNNNNKNPFGFGTNQRQQLASNNPYGFGNNKQPPPQQQQPNPFGFGVQGGAKQQFKPFENKWTRDGANSTRKPENQPQPTDHDCTDPESCKRLIAEDFRHERPLWKLTCYGHWKNAPCDIFGDVSYEELRTSAYDDAKRGMSLQSIVEKERSLLNAKLVEFENLLRNPYVAPSKSGLLNQGSFPAAFSSAFSPTIQNTVSSVPSFTQVNPSIDMSFGTRSSAASNHVFMQPSPFSNAMLTPSVSGMKNAPSGIAGPFGSQPYNQAFVNSNSSNVANFGNSGITGTQITSSSPAAATQNPHPFSFQPPNISTVSSFASIPGGQANTNIPSQENMQKDAVSVDATIWLKEKWTPGEIPEEAPPKAYV